MFIVETTTSQSDATVNQDRRRRSKALNIVQSTLPDDERSPCPALPLKHSPAEEFLQVVPPNRVQKVPTKAYEANSPNVVKQ